MLIVPVDVPKSSDGPVFFNFYNINLRMWTVLLTPSNCHLSLAQFGLYEQPREDWLNG